MAENYYGYEVRQPYPSENAFFRDNLDTAGMATEDGRIILNQFSNNTPLEMRSVARNEAVRLWLRDNNIRPDFEITPDQQRLFSGTEYGKPENIQQLRNTILSRVLSGDPSAGETTPDQQRWVEMVRRRLPK